MVFVNNLKGGQEDAAIVSAIIGLGKTLGLTVTAEGVETDAQQSFLTLEGCDLLQGFLLGRPASPDALEDDLMATRTTRYADLEVEEAVAEYA